MSRKTGTISATIPNHILTSMEEYSKESYSNWSKVATEAFVELIRRGKIAHISHQKGWWLASCGENIVARDTTLNGLYEQLDDLGL